MPHDRLLTLLEGWAAGRVRSAVFRSACPPGECTPVAAAWLKAVNLRPLLCPADSLEGLRETVRRGRCEPRRRPAQDAALRLCLMTLCARAARAHEDGDVMRFNESMEHPVFLEKGPSHFEHDEARLLLRPGVRSLGPRGLAPLARRVAAAAALAWALGWGSMRGATLESLYRMLPESGAAFRAAVSRARLAPLADLRSALVAASEDPSREEESRALRWLTEPWWPELALTPGSETARRDPADQAAAE